MQSASPAPGNSHPMRSAGMGRERAPQHHLPRAGFQSALRSSASTALAASAEEAGFCPVTRLPSVTA